MIASPRSRLLQSATAFRNRLWRDRRGGVFMIMGFAIIPLTFATGMSIDYAQAMRLQTKLNAAADAASLAATSQSEMDQSISDATDRAKQMFQTQVDGTVGLKPIDYADSSQFSISVTEKTTATGVQRTATVNYRALSLNSFAGILGMATLTIKGTSQALASTAPNIDFYLLLDISSSMALPTTSAGLAQLKSATGCAFACHKDTSESSDLARDKNNILTDYYGVARSYSIPLRIDAMTSATQSLMTVASSTSSENGASYRMSVSTFSEANTFNNIAPLTSDLSAAGDTAATVQIARYYKNSWPSSSRNNNDQDSAHSEAFDKINTLMPLPGNGTKATNDKPQEIMFIITDGARDEFRPGGKPELAIDTSKCDAVKNRGIRIAVLYTEYLPDSVAGNSWSIDPNQGNVLNRLPQIATALESCASDGLYYKVTTDDDISAALNSLFQKAVATSHLTR